MSNCPTPGDSLAGHTITPRTTAVHSVRMSSTAELNAELAGCKEQLAACHRWGGKKLAEDLKQDAGGSATPADGALMLDHDWVHPQEGKLLLLSADPKEDVHVGSTEATEWCWGTTEDMRGMLEKTGELNLEEGGELGGNEDMGCEECGAEGSALRAVVETTRSGELQLRVVVTLACDDGYDCPGEEGGEFIFTVLGAKGEAEEGVVVKKRKAAAAGEGGGGAAAGAKKPKAEQPPLWIVLEVEAPLNNQDGGSIEGWEHETVKAKVLGTFSSLTEAEAAKTHRLKGEKLLQTAYEDLVGVEMHGDLSGDLYAVDMDVTHAMLVHIREIAPPSLPALALARVENEKLREQLASATAQNEHELVDLTADGDGGGGGAAAPEPSPAKREKPPSAMAQLHGAQQVKLEAVEEMQDEGQYAAQFIDKLQSKIDKLKQLAAQAGADGAAIEEAVK